MSTIADIPSAVTLAEPMLLAEGAPIDTEALHQQWEDGVFAVIRAQNQDHLLVMVGERFDLSEFGRYRTPHQRLA